MDNLSQFLFSSSVLILFLHTLDFFFISVVISNIGILFGLSQGAYLWTIFDNVMFILMLNFIVKYFDSQFFEYIFLLDYICDKITSLTFLVKLFDQLILDPLVRLLNFIKNFINKLLHSLFDLLLSKLH